MNLRRVVVLATATAGVVIMVAAVGGATNLAMAAVGVAVLGVLGYLVLSLRSLAESVTTATRTAERARQDAAAVAGGSDASPRSRRETPPSDNDAIVARRLQRTQRRLGELARSQVEIRNALDRAPGRTAEMIRAYERLVTHQHPMPELGGWAATPPTVLWMLDRVMSTPARTLVECGSGTSTVWLATALDRRGGDGRVVALEASEHYAALTRAELERLGLSDRASVIDAPLVDASLPDGSAQPWYELSELELAGPIDLLFVDGPPSKVASGARYPAFPLLADRLAPGAVVILDDTGRPAEQEILERWTREVHDGRALELSHTVDRSTVLVARAV